ncbi:MAG: imidazoleglycerol-phosphate dehydratase HisB [Opitutales bacterium]
MSTDRQAKATRDTAETRISLALFIDGKGTAEIETGIPFFDHMLTLFARHGLFDLSIRAEGDLTVDYHHTVEDTGLLLGQVFKEALGDKAGIRRYGFFLLPMDETLARAVVDLSNRPAFVYRVASEPATPMVRDFNIHLMREFYQAFANTAGCNLHLLAEYGDEPHHIAEGMIKAFARALDAATTVDPRLDGALWTTKGTLS